MSDAIMASLRERCCSSLYILSSSEKTRSHEAELGEIAKTMRAPRHHAGNLLPLMRHQLSSASV